MHTQHGWITTDDANAAGHSAAEGEDESDDQREIDTSVENANNDQGGRRSTSHFVGIGELERSFNDL